MSTLNTSAGAELERIPSSSDLATLRSVLFGKDYHELIVLKDKLQDHHKYSESIANVISEALSIRSAQDNSVAMALAPTIQSALNQSIIENPKPMADALYPVMGPAIRKSISEALSQMMETLNQLLEQSLTLKSLLWRFEAWKTGRSFSEVVLLKTLAFQVEQVFLINRKDGLLLQHVAIDSAVTQDGDMLSGMLTAIQDFISDSFVDYGAENTGINTLKLGDLTVFIEHSSNVILAMVIRGKPPESVRQLQATTLEYIQTKYATALRDFNGDNHPFDSTRPLLERCLKSQKQKQKTSRLPLLLFSLFLMSVLSYWGYSAYHNQLTEKESQRVAKNLAEQQKKQWGRLIDSLNTEPGLVVINDRQEMAQIELLRDPLARLPEKVIESLNMNGPVTFVTKPYLSIEDEILLLRAQQLLTPPNSVSFAVKNMELSVAGKASLDWGTMLQNKWQQITGVRQINIKKLVVVDPNLPRLMSLKKQIEAESIDFDNNRSLLSSVSTKQIKSISEKLKQMMDLASESNKTIKLSIMGFSDSSGTELINNQLSQQRANRVKQALIEDGVAQSAFIREASKIKIKRNERSVRFHALIQ